MPNGILIIEDNTDLANALASILEEEGYHAIVASSGAQGLRVAKESQPQLIVLDDGLPDIHGIDVCRRLIESKHTGHIPVIIVGEKHDEIDRVVSFELGASDFLAKPFSTRELVLRIRAILRRVRPTKPDPELIKLGPFVVDRKSYRVTILGKEVSVTRSEFDILYILAQEPGHAFTREELLAQTITEADGISDRSIDVHVMRLRKKLKPFSSMIKTVRAVGYRLSEQKELSSLVYQLEERAARG